MKNCDYKFWYISRNDNGHIIECTVRFYEGEVTAEVEGDAFITRYRRTKRLSLMDLPHFEKAKIKKEASGEDVIVYTPKDFGVISTDDELRLFLNKELAKDKNRTPIPEQKWQ